MPARRTRRIRRRSKTRLRQYPPVTSTRLIGFFRRMKTLPTIGQIERLVIEEGLRRNWGNKSETARQLGMTREGLRKKLNRMSESRRRSVPRSQTRR